MKISNSRSFKNGGLEVRRNWVRKESKIISNVLDDTGLDRLQIRLIHFILKRCLLVFLTFYSEYESVDFVALAQHHSMSLGPLFLTRRVTVKNDLTSTFLQTFHFDFRKKYDPIPSSIRKSYPDVFKKHKLRFYSILSSLTARKLLKYRFVKNLSCFLIRTTSIESMLSILQ